MIAVISEDLDLFLRDLRFRTDAELGREADPFPPGAAGSGARPSIRLDGLRDRLHRQQLGLKTRVLEFVRETTNKREGQIRVLRHPSQHIFFEKDRTTDSKQQPRRSTSVKPQPRVLLTPRLEFISDSQRVSDRAQDRKSIFCARILALLEVLPILRHRVGDVRKA